MRSLLLMIFLAWGTGIINAQVPVRECDVLFRKHIVRSIDLRAKTNSDIFRRTEGITKILLDAIDQGKLKAYAHNDKNLELSREDFLNKLKIPSDSDLTEAYTDYHLYKMEIGEDLIFDKQRSVPVYEIKYLTLYIPEEINYKGILEPIATLKYADCLRIFKEDQRAWGDLNNGKLLNFKEVFLLHQYQSRIVKIGNENEMYFDQKYNTDLEAFLAAKEEENKIVEFFYKIYNPQ